MRKLSIDGDKFADLVLKLEPVEFIGLCKVLGVAVFEDEKPRDFYDMLDGCIEKFQELNRSRRKEILKLMKDAVSKRK